MSEAAGLNLKSERPEGAEATSQEMPAGIGPGEPEELQPAPDWLDAAMEAAADRKAVDVRLLDLRGKCDYADFFLICSGRSDRQVVAIADSIAAKLKEVGQRPLHTEGQRQARWILIDYADLVVHVFDPPTREFYRLERLWSDAPLLARSNAEGVEDPALDGR